MLLPFRLIMVLLAVLGSMGRQMWISSEAESSGTKDSNDYAVDSDSNNDTTNDNDIASIRGYVSSWKSHRRLRHRHRHRLRHRHRHQQRFQPLCTTLSETVHLNTDLYEFDPPFYVQKKCKALPTASISHELSKTSQKCAFDLFECVQVYGTIQLSRRRTGTHCWQPYSLRIAHDCQCMWPAHKYGPINAKDEL